MLRDTSAMRAVERRLMPSTRHLRMRTFLARGMEFKPTISSCTFVQYKQGRSLSRGGMRSYGEVFAVDDERSITTLRPRTNSARVALCSSRCLFLDRLAIRICRKPTAARLSAVIPSRTVNKSPVVIGCHTTQGALDWIVSIPLMLQSPVRAQPDMWGGDGVNHIPTGYDCNDPIIAKTDRRTVILALHWPSPIPLEQPACRVAHRIQEPLESLGSLPRLGE